MTEFNKAYYDLIDAKKNIFYMKKAIHNSNISKGGPFGCIIVKNNEVISEAFNTVTVDNDPTAHAEVNAIRNACKKLNNFDLSDCILYTSCEPCPMCLSAIYWSRINKVYYANTRHDAANIGFSDNFIYEELSKNNNEKNIELIKIDNTDAINTFINWDKNNEKIKY